MKNRHGEGVPDAKVAALADATHLVELRTELEAVEKRRTRHLLWVALGASPAAILPFLGLIIEGDIALVAILAVLVALIELVRWWRAGAEASGLRESIFEAERRIQDSPSA